MDTQLVSEHSNRKTDAQVVDSYPNLILFFGRRCTSKYQYQYQYQYEYGKVLAAPCPKNFGLTYILNKTDYN